MSKDWLSSKPMSRDEYDSALREASLAKRQGYDQAAAIMEREAYKEYYNIRGNKCFS